jgi:hypothetical protein
VQMIVAEMPDGAGAMCRDGWWSFSSGSGTCSWHGGVRHWAYALRERAEAEHILPTFWQREAIPIAVTCALWLWGVLRVFAAQRRLTLENPPAFPDLTLSSESKSP